jgi:cysteine desulfuration protein SufE
MSHPAAFTEIAENLSYLDDWEDRYKYIIELGQALPPLAESEKNAATKVNGCVSQVWLVSERVGNLLSYRGESDAMIVRGLAAILIALYSGRTAQEIAETDAIVLFDELGLREHLSTQRSNGLVAMVNRIRAEARAIAA